MAKEKKEYILKDITGRTVEIGDQVVLLYKTYGFRKLSTAELLLTTYTGHGQYGYTFRYENRYGCNTVNIREPEVAIMWREPKED